MDSWLGHHGFFHESLSLLALPSLSEFLFSHFIDIGRLVHELTVEELEDCSEKTKNGHEADDASASTHVFDVNEGDLGLSKRLAHVLLRLPLQVVRIFFDLV